MKPISPSWRFARSGTAANDDILEIRLSVHGGIASQARRNKQLVKVGEEEADLKRHSIREAAAWLLSSVAAIVLIYVPASVLLLAVVMGLGFSSSPSIIVKMVVLAATLVAIAGATFILAWMIKIAVFRD
jgi:hypothetical protein